MIDVDREFKLVPARKIQRIYAVLPRRHSYDDEILESMKKAGVQQPLIVRPLPSDPDEYEIIDGFMRRLAFEDDDLILVDVRYGIKDSDVFKISDITFKRKQRTTYERAEFFSRWVMVERKENGKKGAQARVAKETRLTEGEISQYLAIHRMFTELEGLPGSAAINFDALNYQGINKLYELSRLIETPVFLTVAEQLAQNPSMPVRELRHVVKEETSTEKMLLRLDNEDPFETEKPEKTDYTEIFKLTQEILNIAEDTRKNLETFKTRIKLSPKRFLKPKTLKELQKLQRRFKRLRKDVAKLPDRTYPKVSGLTR